MKSGRCAKHCSCVRSLSIRGLCQHAATARALVDLLEETAGAKERGTTHIDKLGPPTDVFSLDFRGQRGRNDPAGGVPAGQPGPECPWGGGRVGRTLFGVGGSAMRRIVSIVVLGVAISLGTGGITAPAEAATTGNTAPQPGKIVSEDPADFTPNILDGTVNSITQIGDKIIVGGTFTQVQEVNSSVILTRNHLLAFNATTGKVSTTFTPNPNGTVYKVQAAADGSTVYIGGLFTSAAGQAVKNLYQANTTTGAPIATFKPPTLDGQVRDLEVVGNRLWVAGKFTHMGGRAQRALGTLNAITGAFDGYFTGVLAGLHNPALAGSVTDVLQISTNPTNSRLTAVGNFTTVNGASRSQVAMFDISGTTSYTLAPWSTTLYTSACSSKFDTYMSDVEYSPDGSYFVISTTGAYGGSSSITGNSGCDVVARFEADGAAGARPTWTAYTGGDTTWTVEVTDRVICAGGHQRWQNNPTAGDKAGQGAVSRTGIAALDPVNGMPYTWNPTRTRGVGIQDMLATPAGLWIGSDTDRIGKNAEVHSDIAFMPLAGGKTLPTPSDVSLPGDVFSVASGGTQLVRRGFDGTTATTPVNAANGAVPWGSAVGGFMINGTLYTATSDGALRKQTFNGSTYGPSAPVNTADLIVSQSDWHVTDVPTLTSLFQYRGRIFFTRSGQTTLFTRAFEDESDVVGQQRFSSAAVAGIDYSTVRGAFVANNKFYYANTTGQLFRADWSSNGPVGGTSVQVSGPGRDPQNWTSRAMFVYQGVPLSTNRPPSAVVTVSCAQLTCSFDGSRSSDPEGPISSYSWNFGDGSTGTGATANHTYAAGGSLVATLAVTDAAGATSTTNVTATPATATTSSGIAHVA